MSAGELQRDKKVEESPLAILVYFRGDSQATYHFFDSFLIQQLLHAVTASIFVRTHQYCYSTPPAPLSLGNITQRHYCVCPLDRLGI